MSAAEQIPISPCPFCCGPPVPHCHRLDEPRGPIGKAGPFSEQGDYCEAYVFCHECGAQGPAATGDGMGGDFAYEAADVTRLELEAVTLWNERNARHLELFEYGSRDGLNRYPRDHAAEDVSRALRKATPAILAKLEQVAATCDTCYGVRSEGCRDCADIRAVIDLAKGVAP